MTVTAGAKSRVFCLASRVVLHGDAGPVVDGVAQADVGGLAHEHDAALAGALGDGSHPRQASKRSIVAPLQGLEGLGQQRGKDNPSDSRQRLEDRHIARLGPLLLGSLLRSHKAVGEAVEPLIDHEHLSVHQIEPLGDGLEMGRRRAHRAGRKRDRGRAQPLEHVGCREPPDPVAFEQAINRRSRTRVAFSGIGIKRQRSRNQGAATSSVSPSICG